MLFTIHTNYQQAIARLGSPSSIQLTGPSDEYSPKLEIGRQVSLVK
jgi:hypothetical protein